MGFSPLILKEILQEFAQGGFIEGLPGSVASRGGDLFSRVSEPQGRSSFASKPRDVIHHVQFSKKNFGRKKNSSSLI